MNDNIAWFCSLFIAMESETGAKITIRGKGSWKEGKVDQIDGRAFPGEDEPLHAYVTSTNPEAVKKAVDKIRNIIKEAVDSPEGRNDLRLYQLQELALLEGRPCKYTFYHEIFRDTLEYHAYKKDTIPPVSCL